MCIRNFDASLDGCQWSSGFSVGVWGSPLAVVFWRLNFDAPTVYSIVFLAFARQNYGSAAEKVICLPPVVLLLVRVPSAAAYVRRENCSHKWRPAREPLPALPGPVMHHAGRPSSLEFIFIVLRNFQLLQLYQYMNIDSPCSVAFRSRDFNYGNCADSDNQRLMRIRWRSPFNSKAMANKYVCEGCA